MTLSQSCCQDLGGKGKGPRPKAGGPGLQHATPPKGGGHGDEELLSSTAVIPHLRPAPCRDKGFDIHHCVCMSRHPMGFSPTAEMGSLNPGEGRHQH